MGREARRNRSSEKCKKQWRGSPEKITMRFGAKMQAKWSVGWDALWHRVEVGRLEQADRKAARS